MLKLTDEEFEMLSKRLSRQFSYRRFDDFRYDEKTNMLSARCCRDGFGNCLGKRVSLEVRRGPKGLYLSGPGAFE